MNLKVANLIAIQLGIFVGIMSWLAYSHLEFGAPRIATELPERAVRSVAPLVPGLKADDQHSDAVDDPADSDEPQPIAEQPSLAMHQYSPATVQRYSELAAQQYYQQIAPRRYTSSGPQNGPVVAEKPSYAEAAQEPAEVSDYPAPQTAAYVQPAQFIVYPQPQLIVFSNSRRFANRCRPAPPVTGAHLATTHRRPDRPRPHLSGSTESRPNNSFGIVQRQNDKSASCRATDGLGPRGRR
jgi:hypothetical protein